jgi:hypothetical protein
MSLIEESEISLSSDSSVSEESKKRARDEMAEDERKEERKAANRRSAFQSRMRKKLLIEELQEKVNKLSGDLSALKAHNRTLALGLEASLFENRRLRLVQQRGGLAATQVIGRRTPLLPQPSPLGALRGAFSGLIGL